MEDILLSMYNKNKCLPYLILEDGQYIFIGDLKIPFDMMNIVKFLIILIKLYFRLRVFLIKITLLIQRGLLGIVNLFVVNAIPIKLLEKILIGKYYI